MFSIGEFARLGGVSVRTLRHYDEIGLLRPATVDPGTGYRGYSAQQLGQLNRIMALKELGLSLTQARRLLGGITLDELRGMLVLRRAQLEHELEQHNNQLLGVEGRLRSIAREGAMPADDIVAKQIPAMGVVVVLLVVGFTLVLPQVVGFATARYGRWAPAYAWPLGAAGTVALYVVILMARDHQLAQQARAAGHYVCGLGMVVTTFLGFFLLCFHVVLGRIYGGLEERERRSFGGGAGGHTAD